MLGRLEQIPNIRMTWPNEASDFTPWLSRPENLSILSEALGMGSDGLEFEASEEGVGPFRADIICRDTGTAEGARVLIENQFGQSDHDHLGKLLTYASGLDVRTVILIGERIRDEHRAALDWLNDITGDDHNFFACELELWRIGDSLPAPRFNVVVQPNDWSREVKRLSSEAGTPSELKLTYLRFWETFNEVLEDSDCPLRPRKPAAKQWMDHSLGKTGVILRTAISEREGRVRVGVYLQGDAAKSWFASLEAERPKIEAAFGQTLNWDPLTHRQSSWIGLSLTPADPTNEADWPRQHDWLVDTLGRFHAVFKPFVMALSHDPRTSETIEAIE